LWLATGAGVLCFDPASGEAAPYSHDPASPYSVSHKRVMAVYVDQDDMLWIGTDGGGLDRFDPAAGVFRHYHNDPDDEQSLSYDSILCITEDRQGYLWIGTAGGGLNKFDRQSEIFTRCTEADGLPNNTVYGILEDTRGNLWLSTNNGLSRFTPATAIFKNYDVNYGVQSTEFNTGAYFKNPRSGEMFFGGINGVNTFFLNR
jgi:ligand-binding sensor domain-containing protein